MKYFQHYTMVSQHTVQEEEICMEGTECLDIPLNVGFSNRLGYILRTHFHDLQGYQQSKIGWISSDKSLVCTLVRSFRRNLYHVVRSNQHILFFVTSFDVSNTKIIHCRQHISQNYIYWQHHKIRTPSFKECIQFNSESILLNSVL